MGSRIIGIIFGIGIVGALMAWWAWDGLKLPSNTPPSKTFSQVPTVLKGNEDLTKLTGDLEKHGDLPVKLDPSEMGREDPLAQP